MSTSGRSLAASKAKPLGRLMHGQRELFHRNLIGWFFNTLPEAADAAFRPLACPVRIPDDRPLDLDGELLDELGEGPCWCREAVYASSRTTHTDDGLLGDHVPPTNPASRSLCCVAD
jgi:hypothetical protein